MEFFKLQIGCLLVCLYISMVYIRHTRKGQVPCNCLFDILLFICPLQIFFDGLTAWTVNHLDVVPQQINIILHAGFYIFSVLGLFFIFLYYYDVIDGLPQKLIQKCILAAPVIISIILILIFLPQTDFIIGQETNYSMGMSVYICYATIIIYCIGILFMTMFHKRRIPRKKFINTMGFILVCFAVLIFQCIYPEALITCLVPMFLLLGLYMNIEDPAIRRLEAFNQEMTVGFATLVENRDNSTGGHIKRTKTYVEIILREMRRDKSYHEVLTRDFVNNMRTAAPMHDIGKIATPDYILQKPGALTDEEFNIMKEHAAIGGDIIKESFARIDEPEFLDTAYQVARFHHEKWNGKGYPDGLKEKEIPLCARIMAIADVFDAVSADRCYRKALPLEQCFSIIEEGAGRDFDPNLVKCFLNARDKVIKVVNE